MIDITLTFFTKKLIYKKPCILALKRLRNFSIEITRFQTKKFITAMRQNFLPKCLYNFYLDRLNVEITIQG